MNIAEPDYTAEDEARDRRREASLPLAEPPDALKAAKCACDQPWLERDDQGAHCIACGRDI